MSVFPLININKPLNSPLSLPIYRRRQQIPHFQRCWSTGRRRNSIPENGQCDGFTNLFCSPVNARVHREDLWRPGLIRCPPSTKVKELNTLWSFQMYQTESCAYLYLQESIIFCCQLVRLLCCFRLSCCTWAGIVHCHQNKTASLTSLTLRRWHCRLAHNYCYDTRICRPEGESYKKNSPVEKQSFSCIFPR